jgi:broad specificity phosphatase PhoE
MNEILLVRPGATAYDEQNRIQGVLDLPLSDRGRSEVELLVEPLRELTFAAIYCGPGESVTGTAEALARAAGLRVKKIDELRNLDMGLWQGLQVEEVRRRNPKVYRQWLDEPRTICPPEGETVEEGMDRARQILKGILRRHKDERIAMVVGDPMAWIMAGILRREPQATQPDRLVTGWAERILVGGEVLRNGERT